ncbi:MAG: glycoside hydrolase family 9 protein [Lachnospiraceae bacterium]
MGKNRKKKNWNAFMKRVTATTLAAVVGISGFSSFGTLMTVKAAEKADSTGADTSSSTEEPKYDPNIPEGSGLDYDYARALQYSMYFYDGNMCGTGVSENSQFSWRGDCHTYDAEVPLQPMNEKEVGTNLSQEFIDEYRDVLDPDGDGCVDVSGGFHDAGDHVKFGMPENYTAATLGWGYYEFRDSYTKLGQDSHIETILRYFNDYLMKCTFRDKKGDVIAHCYQVGDGDIDHAYWEAPEVDSMARPAYFLTVDKPQTDYVVSAAASLTINYLNFKDTDPKYAEKSLDYAKALWKFANTHEKQLSDNGDGPKAYYYSNKWEDDYCWAGAWLYKATEDVEYLNQILPHIDYYAPSGWAYCWNDTWSGVATLLGEIDLEHPELDLQNMYREVQGKTQYESADFWEQVEKAIDTWMTHYTTPGGYAFLNVWGSARYNTSMQMVTLIYEKYHNNGTPSKYAQWAESQMKYLMGNNKLHRCYIVGYNQHSVRYPHHRAASGLLMAEDTREQKHVLFGALAGGPDGKDDHHDTTNDWVYNEVTIDYNAAFVGACAGLYHFFGTDEMAVTENFPPAEIPKEDESGNGGKGYWVEAFAVDDLSTDGAKAGVTKISLKVMTSEPEARKDISVRYFFNTSEVANVDGLEVKDLYDQARAEVEGFDGATIKGPIKYDKLEDTYYAEIKWDGYAIANSGKKYQFRMGMYWGDTWDPTNDYSYQNLPVLTDNEMFENGNEVPTDRICVYADGTLVGGVEPDGTTPNGEKQDQSGDQTEKEIPVTNITFREHERTMKIGDTFTPMVTVIPKNATNPKLTWTSSDDSIATVEDGKITALKQGEAVITATSADGKKSAICKITVKGNEEQPSEGTPSGSTKPSSVTEPSKGSTEKPSAKPSSQDPETGSQPSQGSSKPSAGSQPSQGTSGPSAGSRPSQGSSKPSAGSQPSQGTSGPSAGTQPSEGTEPSDEPQGGSDVPVTDIELSEKVKVLKIGETFTLKANVIPSNATEKSLAWKLEDASYISLKDNGVITALKEGQSKVTVTSADGTVSRSCLVIVTGKEEDPSEGGSSASGSSDSEKVPVKDLTLNETFRAMSVGDNLQLIPTIEPSNATNKEVQYHSTNESVARVDKNGLVTIVGVGDADIVVTTVDGSISKKCSITVPDEDETVHVKGLEFVESQVTMTVGETKSFQYKVTPANADTSELQWHSTDENVVAFTKTGEARALQSGQVIITIQNANATVYASCLVTVKEAAAKPTSISLNKGNFTTTVGSSVTITATVKPSKATQTVGFKSSNSNVLKISSYTTKSAKLQAKAPGTVTITVYAKGATSVTKKITVKVKPAKVTGLKKKAVSSKSVKLTWKKQSGVSGYEVYCYDPKKKKYCRYKRVKTNTITVGKLRAKTTYKFKVRAYKNSGSTLYGSYSPELKIKTK